MALGNTLALITTEVQRKVKGTTTSQISAADWTAFIAESLRDYSHHRPREVVNKFSGDGGKYYPINSSNFPNWLDGFSAILSVDVPAITISDDVEPNYKPSKKWVFYKDGTTSYIFFPDNAPGTGDSIVVAYTAIHTITNLESATATTVPDFDITAVTNRAASHACFSLSSYYTQSFDTGSNLGVVDFRNRAREWERLGERYERAFYKHLNVNPDGKPGAAGDFIDLDMRLSGGAGGFLTHPRFWR